MSSQGTGVTHAGADDLVARNGAGRAGPFQRAHEGGGHVVTRFLGLLLGTMMTSDFPFTAGATRWSQ